MAQAPWVVSSTFSATCPTSLKSRPVQAAAFYDAPPSSDHSLTATDYTPWFWNTYVGIGNKSGKLNYSLLYTHSDDDGYRQNTQTLLNDVKLKATLRHRCETVPAAHLIL